MRAKFLCFFGILLATLLSSQTFAYADFAPYGGFDGTAFSKSCPANQYVAGFFGHVGGWLDNIGLTCAPAFGTTSFGAPVQTPQFFGGLGGATSATQCENGTAVSHIHLFIQFDQAHYNDPQYIRGISYDCAHADGSPVSNKCFGVCHDGDKSSSIGVTFGVSQPGSTDNNCAPGLMTGLSGRTGQYVVALAAICSPRPSLVAANPAPPKQVASNAGQPIKITGGTGTVPDKVLMCQGGGMTVTPSNSSIQVSFAQAPQGGSAAQPAPGQCAWSSGPIGGAFNKLILSNALPMGQQLQQVAQNGGSFIAEGRTLGAGMIMVVRVDSIQPAGSATSSGTAAPSKANGAATQAGGSGFVLVCQGGGGMRISGGGATIGGPSYAIVSFKAASEAGNSGQLEPGSCAWINRPLNAAEPPVLDIPNDLQNADALKQALKHGSFQVHANNTGKALLVNQIDSVQGAGGQSGDTATGTGAPTGGNGTAKGGSVLMPPIAEGNDSGGGQAAKITKAVNVHTTAGGGQVLGSLAAGTSVSSLGCSKGWCHIQFAGGEGWVAQSFLAQ